jgi:hypothetical protein
MYCILHSHCLRLWREGLPECIGLNHHLVNVVALRALKRADIETHTCRRDASERHVSAALWASRTMEVKVDIVRQEIGFLHDAFLVEEAALLWRDQLALEPVHCRLGLHRVAKLHRRLKLTRATMTFKGPKVITGRAFLEASQEHFGLALRTDYLPQLGHDAHP